MFVQKLSRTQQRGFDKKIYGYDIETYGQKNKFLCASVYYDDNNQWQFDNKEDIIKFFKTKRFRNSYVSCTNLLFDFMGTYFGHEDELGFNLLFRGSELITAKTWVRNAKLYPTRTKSKGGHNLTFIDTLNYARLSVEKLGKIIGFDKLKKPKCLGKKPKNIAEYKELIEYNMRDSEISKKGLDFLYRSFINLGATPKPTIAATAMSLFKNKYLYNDFFVHKQDELLEQFKSYHGGRCEAFCRGRIENFKYYDFNSLYPYVMTKEFPDPNTMRHTYKNDINYIMEFDGLSDVTVTTPNNEEATPQEFYPLLPHRTDIKLLFPMGILRGWYTHVELRRALQLGNVINKIHKTYYFTRTISPFKDYVEALYKKRLIYKKENNPMEYVTKILMNSLYGKFGQKFWERDNWQPFTHTLEELNELQDFERFGQYIRIKKAMQRPSSFCFPIWASYITSYARIHLHDAILKSMPVYCDTDSLVTAREIETSDRLGDLKLEMDVKFGFIVKPKFYALSDGTNDYVKIKGLGTRLNMEQFLEFLQNPKKAYNKFVKFKEAVRRGLLPNEIIEIVKHMDLEDTKRVWLEKFDPYGFEQGFPKVITNGVSSI